MKAQSCAVNAVAMFPSPLYAEGLQTLLGGTRFKPVWHPHTESAYPLDGNKPGLFIIGSAIIKRHNQLIKEILSKYPTEKVVVICTASERLPADSAIYMGANGFIDETAAADKLEFALELIMDGATVISARRNDIGLKSAIPVVCGPSVVECNDPIIVETISELQPFREGAEVAEEEEAAEDEGKYVHLPGREQQVLDGLRRGLSNKSIARELMIAEATVKGTLKKLLRKLHVDNRTKAAIWATENWRQLSAFRNRSA